MKLFGLFVLMIFLGLLTAYSQNERKFVRSGNRYFMDAVEDTTKLDTSKFSKAETEYRKALNKKPDNSKWDFNLADALYKQMQFDQAEQKFSELSKELETPEEEARALHNLGNSQLMQQKIDESIESYKEALRKNPGDFDTKYNLAYAKMLKKKQQQQQQQQNKDQKQNQDQQKNQDQKNQQNQQDQQKNKQQQQQQQDQQQNQQQQQQRQNKISRQDAEQLLQALQNDERKIQEKVKKEKAAKARKSRVEKEW